MSASADDRPLVTRIQSVRRSLRGAIRTQIEESPVEEYERRQSELAYDAKERLTESGCAWLAAQAMTMVVAVVAAGWTFERPAWLTLAIMIPWLASMPIATAMAVVVFRSLDALPRRWIACGLVPWGALVAEATAVLVFVL